MSMTYPHCGAWTSVKETRTRKTDGVVTRRYERANLHRFSTEERVRVKTETVQSLPCGGAPAPVELFRQP
jgi:hypothetical protein